jgi:hypothetical protein
MLPLTVFNALVLLAVVAPFALLLPFSALCFGYAIVRSVYLAETRGVRWRGTTYPLALLRGQSGLEGTAANRSR